MMRAYEASESGDMGHRGIKVWGIGEEGYYSSDF